MTRKHFDEECRFTPNPSSLPLESNSRVQVAIGTISRHRLFQSLSYLTEFPIDTLKIDQSFVHQIAASESDTSIVTAIISMGHSLHMRVVAEGVETQEEAAFLRAQNCDEAQGYYFSRPVDADQFAALLRTGISPGLSTGITAGLSKEAALTQRQEWLPHTKISNRLILRVTEAFSPSRRTCIWEATGEQAPSRSKCSTLVRPGPREMVA